MSVKLYMQTSGALVETFNTFDGKPIGQWVAHEDYLALRDALREALDGWKDCMQFGLDKKRRERNFKRIAELRKFLDDK